MLYLKDDKYYMLRNREYVKVDVELSNGELSIKPDRSDVIEANDNVKVKSIKIEDVINTLKNKDNGYNTQGDTRRKKYDM